MKKSTTVKLKPLETKPLPKLLDELVHNFNVKSAEKWFIDNLITKGGKPVEIRDRWEELSQFKNANSGTFWFLTQRPVPISLPFSK